MKTERQYYVRGNKVPSLQHYMRIRKADKEFDEELIKEMFNKDIPNAIPPETVVKEWRKAKPYTLEELEKDFEGNTDLIKVFKEILKENEETNKMKKTKDYLKGECQRLENNYWEYQEKVSEKEKELKRLESELNALKGDLKKISVDRDKFRSMYREVDPEGEINL
jgi:peptidoglycan hydrolase CwlO-like protein